MDIKFEKYLFQPEKQVSKNLFEGRASLVNEILHYFPSAKSGNPQHFFIIGEMGMGKTSTTHVISNSAKNKHSMIVAHIINDEITTIEELIIQIVERIVNSSQYDKSKLFELAKTHTGSFEVTGMNIKFNPSPEDLKFIKNNFAFYLSDLLQNICRAEGLFIAIDGISGLLKDSNFANWYKNFSDTLNTSISHAPICILLTGYPKEFIVLYEQNPSVVRLFHTYELKRLSYTEVRYFYQSVFSYNNVKLNRLALDMMVDYSSGMPVIMREIADAVFLENDRGFVNEDIALSGIVDASKSVGLKYMQPLLNQEMNDEIYFSIFEKMGRKVAHSPNIPISGRDLHKLLNKQESKAFDDFVDKAYELGIIDVVVSGRRKKYIFTNALYSMYFMVCAISKEVG